MAFLRVVQGGRPGELHEIVADRLVLGRHPSCEVVLDNAVISRQHARLIRQGDQYVIEDLGSRNGTYVNGKAVTGLQAIQDTDRIRICDYILEYLEELPLVEEAVLEDRLYSAASHTLPTRQSRAGSSPRTVENDTFQLEELESSSSIITTLKTGPQSYRLDIRPEVKLRAILEVSSLLSRTLDLQSLLNKTLECLLKLFPQAELGIFLLNDPHTGKPQIKAARSATGDLSTERPVSKAIIERAMLSHEAILSEDVSDDTRFRDSLSASALEIRSLMCVPISNFDGEALGAVQLTTRNLKNVFTQDDLDLLVSVAAQTGLAVENANLHAELLQKNEIERDLEVATQIQLGFLPGRTPSLPGYEFFHYYQAAQQIGGDYFDYVHLPDGRIAVAVGDVSGKGIPAALLMARLCSAVRFHLAAHASIGQALGELNRELLGNSLGFRFITLVIAVLEPDSSRVRLVNAGHLPPLIHELSGSHYLGANCSGLPLGIGSNTEYQEHLFELAPGASMLFYTDGITETTNQADQLFGRENLLKTRPPGEFSAEQLIRLVLTKVDRFAGESSQKDDRCVVAIRNLAGTACR